jgi:nitroreductase
MSTPSPDRDTLRAAVALATRAPSARNTQPWRWLLGAGSIHLYADWTRHAPTADPDGRDLVISCGTALHHLRVALAAMGWHTVVTRVPNPREPHHLAAVEFRRRSRSDRDVTLAATISRRRTDRRRMSSWPTPPDHLDRIAELARLEGALCVVIIDPAARFHVAGAVAQAAVVRENDPDYATEPALWNSRVLTEGKRYGQRTEYVVIATTGDDVLSRLRAGEATSAALLGATELGMATCPLSQPMEIADTRRLIRDDVLDGVAVPQLVIRVGWAPADARKLPFTPRREVEEVFSVNT